MNHWITSGACALSLVACSRQGAPSASPSGAPPTARAANTTRITMELGKDV